MWIDNRDLRQEGRGERRPCRAGLNLHTAQHMPYATLGFDICSDAVRKLSGRKHRHQTGRRLHMGGWTQHLSACGSIFPLAAGCPVLKICFAATRTIC